jgi:hypothetical protein
MYPAAQEQVPLLQAPWPEHTVSFTAVGQIPMLQSSPSNRGSHMHLPSLHRPWPEQSFRQYFSLQSSPMKPLAHLHFMFTQSPWPEHSLGHVAVLQSSPPQPERQ